MLYFVNVKRSCGHTERIVIFGTREERRRQKVWLERTLCPECNNKGCKKVAMDYLTYRDYYADCIAVRHSYEPSADTIVVYVPLERASAEWL